MAAESYKILKKHMIVYLAAEERTGKTLASILVTEMCSNINDVLVLTTRKAKKGWDDTLKEYHSSTSITVDTHGRAKHHNNADYDLVIIDEAHKDFAGYPQPSSTWANARKVCIGKPIIYLSATPNAQGYQQLYHQFKLSDWSPWARYKTFYSWFRQYGISNTAWIAGNERELYNMTDEALCKGTVEHLFVTKTRKELGFAHEPKDKIHYIKLEKKTRDFYNAVLKHRCAIIHERELVCDTPGKLRMSLHMIEGGGIKIENEYLDLPFNEKVQYIKETWGDEESMVIFYNYNSDKAKLEKNFSSAAILQATAYAEGVDLSMYETLIIYSQDFSTARHTQRRARQANRARDTEINVHFLLVENAISEQVYETVSINKQNFVDSVFERNEL